VKKRTPSPVPGSPDWRTQEADRSRTYRNEHRAELAAKARARYLAHRDEKLAWQTEYGAAHRERARIWRDANRDRVRAYSRKHYQAHIEEERERSRARAAATRPARAITNRRAGLRRYGLTPEAYDAMLAEQAGVCAICRRPERATALGKIIPLAVDHDHRTGAVRGLLCRDCNRAIGLFVDDPEILAAAMAYLTPRLVEMTA